MTRCLVVFPDSRAELQDFTGTDSERADAMRAVLGGWLESVRGGDCYALCDEDGKLANKPLNKAATLLAINLGRAGMPPDYLVGTVIFYGGIMVRNEDGIELDVTDKVLDAARQLGLEFDNPHRPV